MKVHLDNVSEYDSLINDMNEKLEQSTENDIGRRLTLLSSLIHLYSRKEDYSTAMKYFDEANSIYIKHIMSNEINEEVENGMISTYYNTARSYHRREDWHSCETMLNEALKLVSKQSKEHQLLPHIHYCMASCNAHRGDIMPAINHYELTVEIARKTLPDDHPDMQIYRTQLEMYKAVLREMCFGN